MKRIAHESTNCPRILESNELLANQRIQQIAHESTNFPRIYESNELPTNQRIVRELSKPKNC